jgi:2-keto-myo-inositol isomerase
MQRRDAIKALSVTSGMTLIGSPSFSFEKEAKASDKFKYCLNTSTISGQKLGVEKYIDIAAKAGYDYIELWIGDIKAYLNNGRSLDSLKKLLDDNKMPVANAIGFAPWMVADDEKRKAGFQQMREEMEIMAALGCSRIAASAAGVTETMEMDLIKIGERYAELLALGKKTGVTPQLEFWGASRFFHIGQALMAAAASHHSGVRILADVYHLFRGNSGFESLKMIDGSVIEIFHMNDYPGTIEREKQEDKDRVYPGDGVAPLKQILSDLNQMKGEKILSLELFNRIYWSQDPFLVAKTGLEKMKKAVQLIK